MLELPIIGSGARYALDPRKIIAVGLNYREHIAESPSILAAEAAARASGGAMAAASRADPTRPHSLREDAQRPSSAPANRSRSPSP